MPELPEVETMVRGLRPALVGRRVLEAEALDPLLLQGISAQELQDRLNCATVEVVERRGKWVVVAAGVVARYHRHPTQEDDGRLWLVPPTRPDHARLKLRMDGPVGLVWFCDNRRLGKIAWYADAGTAEAAFRRSHGPDALVIEPVDLAARLKGTARAVKPALMDQKLVAGIGNIYADEVLHRAGVHPERPASRLKSEEVTRIHLAIGSVLNKAIAAEGSSFDRNYRTVLGSEGGFLNANAVYGRGGSAVLESAGWIVVKVKIAGLVGRPTHYCPHCQPKRPGRGGEAR